MGGRFIAKRYKRPGPVYAFHHGVMERIQRAKNKGIRAAGHEVTVTNQSVKWTVQRRRIDQRKIAAPN